MQIKNMRIIDRGSLKATFEVYLEKNGLHFICSLMDKNGARWVSMPSRPFEVDGQKKYQWQAWWDKEVHKKFEEEVIKLIDAGNFEKAPEPKSPSVQKSYDPEQPDIPF